MKEEEEGGGGQKRSAFDAFLCGSIAGTVSRTLLNPLDVVKVRLQLQQEHKHTAKYAGAINCALTILREEGIRGWWRGIVPGLCLVAPYTAVQFCVYEAALRFCAATPIKEQTPQALITIAAGSVAGFAATLASYPLDAIRTNLAAQGSTHASLVGAYRSLSKRGRGGIFRGIAPTLMSVLPYSAVQFSAFEAMTRALESVDVRYENRHRHGALQSRAGEREDDDVGVGVVGGISSNSTTAATHGDSIVTRNWRDTVSVSAVSGIVAGGLAKGITHPLDVVKKRFQVSGEVRRVGYGASIGGRQYDNVWDCIRKIVAREGVRGLFKGYLTSVAKAAPASAITFTVYKESLAVLDSIRQHREARSSRSSSKTDGNGQRSWSAL